ncbi:MAG: sugar-binding protein, partial [Planctomycetota bacterium]
MSSERWKSALGWLVLLAAASAQAHSSYHLVCPQSKQGGVKVDGDIRGWQGKRFIEVDHTKASFGEAASDDDASFRFAVLWDASHLYLAVRVTDDSVVAAPTLARLYEGDCVEVCLDVANDSEGGYDAGDYQFVLSPTGPGSKPRANLYRNPFLKIGDAAFVRLAANIGLDGYVIEAAFSWEALGLEPEVGHVVGFAIDVRDFDADGSKKGLTWAPALDPAANPLRWGDLILTEAADDDVAAILDALEDKNARWQRLLTGQGREIDNTVSVDVHWVGIGTLRHGVGWNVQFRDGRFPAWTEGTWGA